MSILSVAPNRQKSVEHRDARVAEACACEQRRRSARDGSPSMKIDPGVITLILHDSATCRGSSTRAGADGAEGSLTCAAAGLSRTVRAGLRASARQGRGKQRFQGGLRASVIKRNLTPISTNLRVTETQTKAAESTGCTY